MMIMMMMMMLPWLVSLLLNARRSFSVDLDLELSNDYCVDGVDPQPIEQDCVNYWTVHGNKTVLLDSSRRWIRDRFDFSNTNDQRLLKMLRKLHLNESVHVFVFGGSLTAGRAAGGIAAAWPTRFMNQWILFQQRRLVSGPVITHNLALGGTSRFLLDNLNLYLHDNTVPVDLIVLDYDVNDCTTLGTKKSLQRYFLVDIELLVRQLMLLSSEPALLYFNVAISRSVGVGGSLSPLCLDYKTCYQMDEMKKPIMDRYGVPILSQKLAIWGNFSCPGDSRLWDCSRSCLDPKTHGHELMSILMLKFFYQSSAVHTEVNLLQHGHHFDRSSSSIFSLTTEDRSSLLYVRASLGNTCLGR